MNYIRNNTPCFNCTTETGREVGCHAKCEKYIKYKQDIDFKREMRQLYLRGESVGRI